jgi:hypothetical protein
MTIPTAYARPIDGFGTRFEVTYSDDAGSDPNVPIAIWSGSRRSTAIVWRSAPAQPASGHDHRAQSTGRGVHRRGVLRRLRPANQRRLPGGRERSLSSPRARRKPMPRGKPSSGSKDRDWRAIHAVARPTCGAPQGQPCVDGQQRPRFAGARPLVCPDRRTAWQMIRDGEIKDGR